MQNFAEFFSIEMSEMDCFFLICLKCSFFDVERIQRTQKCLIIHCKELLGFWVVFGGMETPGIYWGFSKFMETPGTFQ
jgi:hypothetical protein